MKNSTHLWMSSWRDGGGEGELEKGKCIFGVEASRKGLPQ
jgi:hypothetical protein